MTACVSSPVAVFVGYQLVSVVFFSCCLELEAWSMEHGAEAHFDQPPSLETKPAPCWHVPRFPRFLYQMAVIGHEIVETCYVSYAAL